MLAVLAVCKLSGWRREGEWAEPAGGVSADEVVGGGLARSPLEHIPEGESPTNRK